MSVHLILKILAEEILLSTLNSLIQIVQVGILSVSDQILLYKVRLSKNFRKSFTESNGIWKPREDSRKKSDNFSITLIFPLILYFYVWVQTTTPLHPSCQHFTVKYVPTEGNLASNLIQQILPRCFAYDCCFSLCSFLNLFSKV